MTWAERAPSGLAWIVGPPLLGWGFFAAWWFGVPVVVLVALWALLLDGPHLWATAWRLRKDQALWPPPPQAVRLATAAGVIGVVLWAFASASGQVGPLRLFLVAAELWGSAHVVRQHEGILALLQARARTPRRQALLERRALRVALLAPTTLVVLRQPEARGLLHLAPDAPLGADQAGGAVAWVVVIVACAVLFACWWSAQRRGEGLAARLLLVGLTAPLFLLLGLSTSISTQVNFVVFSCLISVSHNAQYLPLVHKSVGAEHGGGAAGAARFFFAVFVVAFAVRGLFWLLGNPLSAGLSPGPGHNNIGSSLEMQNAFMVAIWLISMVHYSFDQYI